MMYLSYQTRARDSERPRVVAATNIFIMKFGVDFHILHNCIYYFICPSI